LKGVWKFEYKDGKNMQDVTHGVL